MRLLLMALSLVICCAPAMALQPQDGFFYGVEVEPVGDTTMAAIESEPAVALVFAVDQKTADVTRQFNAWYLRADRPQVHVYAIAVNSNALSPEVVLEAINQRGLEMPVYIAAADMLLGDEFRLLVLNDDGEVARFTTLDLRGAYDALRNIGVDVPAAAPALELAPTPAPDPAVAANTPLPSEPAGIITTTTEIVTTTTTVSPSTEPDTLVLGGEGDSGIYINNLYGMRVQFPPGWQYRVAAKRDGAVAVPPSGSQIDMRIWALPAEGRVSPQDYVDERLKSVAETHKTRVHVERHVHVLRNGSDTVDVTYTYTRPINEAAPERGGLVHRGRMLVFIDNNHVKAAGVSAPGGEFMTMFPIVESFIHSFETLPSDISPTTGYPNPNTI